MLSENEIRILIAKRLMASPRYPGYPFHLGNPFVEGQIYALLAVLTDGTNVSMSGDIRPYFAAAKIPWEPDEKYGWRPTESWLTANGCTLDGDRIRHPKLREEW